jgi:predicted transcriptional regulator
VDRYSYHSEIFHNELQPDCRELFCDFSATLGNFKFIFHHFSLFVRFPDNWSPINALGPGVDVMKERQRLQLLAKNQVLTDNATMSATEIIEQFKGLPANERAQVTKYVVEHDDSWIPDEFKEAMQDAEAGRFVDMEAALFKTPPPPLQ